MAWFTGNPYKNRYVKSRRLTAGNFAVYMRRSGCFTPQALCFAKKPKKMGRFLSKQHHRGYSFYIVLFRIFLLT
jgi:hypothetical protein